MVAGPRPLARALGDDMTAVEPTSEPRAQSAAAPSPFPPIAEYAFLSDCHTGALVAPGRRDRLAVRPALRLAERVRQPARPPGRVLSLRAVRNQPPDRAEVRPRHERPRDDVEDAAGLDRHPRRADHRPPGPRGRDHAAHPPSGRRRRRPHARTNGRMPRGQRRGRAGLRAGLRLRARAGRMDACRRRPPSRRCDGRRPDVPAASDLPLGVEGNRVRARHVLETGRPRVLRALVGQGPRRAAGSSTRRRRSMAATIRFWRVVAGGRPHPGPPLARPDPALGARRSRASPTCRPAPPSRR